MIFRMTALVCCFLVMPLLSIAGINEYQDWKDADGKSSIRVEYIGVVAGQQSYRLYPIRNGKVGTIPVHFNGNDKVTEKKLGSVLGLEIDAEQARKKIKGTKSSDSYPEMENEINVKNKSNDEKSVRINSFLNKAAKLHGGGSKDEIIFLRDSAKKYPPPVPHPVSAPTSPLILGAPTSGAR